MSRPLAASAALCGALALAVPALADPSAAAPSTNHAGAASAAAQSIIARSGAGDLFDNVTTANEPLIRHRRSGLVCNFGVEPAEWPRDDISIFPSGLPRGEDVGCNIHAHGYLVSMDVTRLPTMPDLDAATADTVRSVMTVHPQARRYTGKVVEFQPPATPNFPPYRTIRFVFDEQGGLYSRLSVAIVKDWVIEERVTGPLAQVSFGDLLAGVELLNAIDSVHGGVLLKKP